MKVVALLAMLVLAPLAAPLALAEGPCDNKVERIVCDAVDSFAQLLWWLCNHGVRPACDVTVPLAP